MQMVRLETTFRNEDIFKEYYKRERQKMTSKLRDMKERHLSTMIDLHGGWRKFHNNKGDVLTVISNERTCNWMIVKVKSKRPRDDQNAMRYETSIRHIQEKKNKKIKINFQDFFFFFLSKIRRHG